MNIQDLRKRPTNAPAASTTADLAETRGGLPVVQPRKTKRPVVNRIQLVPGAPAKSNIRIVKVKDPSPQVKAPEYLTKENAPGVGWQARMRRNDSLDQNYRTQLELQNRTALAGLQSRTDLQKTKLGISGDKAVRGMIEGGLNSRQESAANATASLQQQRLDAARGENALDRAFRTASSDVAYDRQTELLSTANAYKDKSDRTAQALELLREGRITSDEQLKKYLTKGPTASPGLKYGSAKAANKLERVAPIYMKRLGTGGETIEEVSPGGYFDPTTGTTTFDTRQADAKNEVLKKLLEGA